jgi:hypothetical protein
MGFINLAPTAFVFTIRCRAKRDSGSSRTRAVPNVRELKNGGKMNFLKVVALA